MNHFQGSLFYQKLQQFWLGYLILNAAIWGGFAVIRHLFWQPFVGLLLGNFFCFVNFCVLALVLERALKDRSRIIRLAVALSYTGRLLVLALVLYAAYTISVDTFVSAILPLLFPKILFWTNRKKG